MGTFAEYLLEKMSELDLNESQLARKIGVHRGTVGRWIKEGLKPGYDNMKKVSYAFNVPLQEIVDAVEGKFKPLTRDEREAMEILKRYSPAAIKLAASKLART